MTKELEETVLVSASFAHHYSGQLTSVGCHILKGVPGEHELFVPAGPSVAGTLDLPTSDGVTSEDLAAAVGAA